jgi:hypothetical protein
MILCIPSQVRELLILHYGKRGLNSGDDFVVDQMSTSRFCLYLLIDNLNNRENIDLNSFGV